MSIYTFQLQNSKFKLFSKSNQHKKTSKTASNLIDFASYNFAISQISQLCKKKFFLFFFDRLEDDIFRLEIKEEWKGKIVNYTSTYICALQHGAWQGLHGRWFSLTKMLSSRLVHRERWQVRRFPGIPPGKNAKLESLSW